MNEKEVWEFESLLSALCDGVIESAQQEQLEQALRESDECRRIYLQFVDMHARLSMHPNLTTGIPIHDDEQIREEDDQVVSELARTSLEQYASDAERARQRRRFTLVARSIGLTLAVLVAVFGWSFYQQWQERQTLPVIASLAGEVTVEGTTEVSNPSPGDYLRPGQKLQTGDDDSQATLKFPDGTKVVVYFNSAIELPNDRSRKTLQLLSGTIDVDAAAQSPDDPLIFKTDHARYVVVGTRFRLYREEEATRLELNEGKVRVERQKDEESVDVTAGQVAVATSESSPIEVTPLATGRSNLIRTLRKAGDAITFSARGETFATSDWQRGLKTWNLDDELPMNELDARVERTFGLAFVRDDNSLVQVNDRGQNGIATLWQIGKKKAKKIRLPGKNVRSRALSPDGQFLAESGEDGLHVYGIDTEKARLSSLAEVSQKGKAWCLSLSESAQTMAAGYWNGTVQLYDVETGAITFEQKFAHTPTKVALSRDGNRLAVFTHKDGLVLIDLVSGRQQSLWAAGVANVLCLRFTTNGERIIAGLNDGTARMWTADGRALLVIDVGHTPRDVAWSAEHSLFITAGGNVNVWQCEIP